MLALFATISLAELVADSESRLNSKNILEQAKRREKLSLYKRNGDSLESVVQDRSNISNSLFPLMAFRIKTK